MYFDTKKEPVVTQFEMNERLESIKFVLTEQLKLQQIRDNKKWEYMEITKVVAADKNDCREYYKTVNVSGTQTEYFDRLNPNIVAVLNFYGQKGWELISVREIESTQSGEYFSVRETYTLKR